MKPHVILVAGALLCASLSVALAQTITGAVVAVDPSSWQAWLGNAYSALVDLAVLAVPVVGGFLAKYLMSKSKLAAMLLSQAMLDKLEQGIQNQIRAEAEKIKNRLPGAAVAGELTPAAKQDIAAKVQPKIEAAFKETLQHFDKKPGSQDVKDMILGHVDAALTKPAPVAIPAVMARS